MLLRQLTDDRLAQYAYLIGCQRTKEAVIIDPERDVDRYIDAAAREGLRITAVTETHIHADFLSGARDLAEKTGATLYLSDEGDADWKYEWAKKTDLPVTLLHDGDSFRVGNIELKAVHTPGHTPEHLAFLVIDHGGGADEPMGLVSGDFVFVGDLGRPDLLESAAQQAGAREPSARKLYDSAQWFLGQPDFMQVWPGHGAGSACGKALGAIPQTTVGYERRFNGALDVAQRDEDQFVKAILDGQTAPPLYFARMKKLNKEGVPPLAALPQPQRLGAERIADLVDSDALVLDTRADRKTFMQAHLPGAQFAPFNKTFPTVVGSLVADPATELVLLIDEADVDAAVRALVRIGYDNITGFVTPDDFAAYRNNGGEITHIDRITTTDLVERYDAPGAAVLDVRFEDEYDAGHVPNATHIPYTRLAERAADVPDAETLYVHCGSGVRAAVSSAFLARTGRNVVYVDGLFADFKANASVEA